MLVVQVQYQHLAVVAEVHLPLTAQVMHQPLVVLAVVVGIIQIKVILLVLPDNQEHLDKDLQVVMLDLAALQELAVVVLVLLDQIHQM